MMRVSCHTSEGWYPVRCLALFWMPAFAGMTILLLSSCQTSPPPKATYIQAEQLFEKHKFVESAHMLSKLLDEDPKLPRARNLLARSFFFLGNPDRSIQELQLTLTNAPIGSHDHLDALFLLGAVTLEAPDLSEDTRTKGQKAWELYLKVAQESELQNQVKAGLAEMKALQKPDKAVELARSYVQKQNASKALSIFRRTLKKHPSHVPAWHYQGMAFIMSGEPKQAVESWKEVLKRDPAYAKKFKLDQRIKIAENL
ncbi:MAG: tetratricopeptide repeat protein [Deltaproteobacteria bacterium]|nr:tetratricopeptide repeat protein [Deltaproteobacteria bacterium]